MSPIECLWNIKELIVNGALTFAIRFLGVRARESWRGVNGQLEWADT